MTRDIPHSEIKTIHIRLLEEGADIWRPTDAISLDDNWFLIIPPENCDPEKEKWEFLPLSRVQCVEEIKNNVPILVAKRAAPKRAELDKIPDAIESLAEWVVDGIDYHKLKMIPDFDQALKVTIEKIKEIRDIDIFNDYQDFPLPIEDGHISSEALAKILVDTLIEKKMMNSQHFQLAFTIAVEEINVIKAMNVYKVIFPSFG